MYTSGQKSGIIHVFNEVCIYLLKSEWKWNVAFIGYVVSMGFYLVVGHSVVPVEEAWGDEIRHHYIHAVMLMRYQDTDHAHCT